MRVLKALIAIILIIFCIALLNVVIKDDSVKKAFIWIFVIIFVIMFLSALVKVRKEKAFSGGSDKSKAQVGIEFERYCMDYLQRKGFRNIQPTAASGDYGADIVATDWRGEKWVFQCKCYSHNVGNSAVQEVVGAKAHYGATRAAVMTNAKLTKQAKVQAWENAVEIIEGLSDW